MLVEVYSDGSATTADKPGGWAYIICVDGVKVAEGSGHLVNATNNVAEITAATNGLKFVDGQGYRNSNGGAPKIVLISDSQLVLRYATGEYQCRKWHLVPYYCALRQVYQKLQAETRWVKGHSGDQWNEACDKLAKAARQLKDNLL